jgi:predicted extracellular nuclease
MRSVRSLVVAVVTAVSLVALAGAGVESAGAVSSDLFFSEYVEGSSNNKAVEIYNGTGTAVPLGAGNYQVRSFHNGGTIANTAVTLTGTVAAGDVYVLAHSSADPAVVAQADQLTAVNWFNGNDAVVLTKGPSNQVVDAIGQIGFDPGTEWGSGLVSTQDNTLRRKGLIEAGDTNATDVFDPAAEWDGFPVNTFSGLGTHAVDANDPVIVNCGPPIALEAETGTTRQVSASDADGRVVSFALSTPPAGVTLANVVPAGVIGGTATADVTIPGSLPSGSHTVVVRASNDDATPQTGECMLTMTVTPPAVPIYELQGAGHVSPYAGTQQRTTGIVTVALGRGFFMQDEKGDGNPATSDGIFVFPSEAATRSVAPGDRVSVAGTVIEFRRADRPRDFGLTEGSPATVTKIGTGTVPLPASISDRPDTVLFPSGAAEFERLEGMLVSVPGAKVVAPTNDFGELSVVAAGDHASATPNGNLLVAPLAMDLVDYNPERIMVDDESRRPGGTGSGTRFSSPQVAVTVGDTASGPIVGALDYQFSNYRVQTNHALSDVLAGSPPPVGNVSGVPATEPFEARIASFNVENLFDCVDAPGKQDAASCNDAALAALETKLTKLTRAFERELGGPEIAIVEETENSEVLNGDADGEVPGTNIRALLPRLNGDWAAVSFDASDVRGIEVAFVYKTDRVTLQDAYLSTTKLPDGGLFSGDADTRPGREPLVGHFTVDDLDLVVVGNHLKSKGGPQFGVDPIEAGDDPLYGPFQPPTRWTELQARHAQADYVRSLVDLLLSAEPGAPVLVGGDLNDFAFGEPGEGRHTIARIAESATAPLHNLVDDVPPNDRYSFIFEGNSQVLDHMLVNGALRGRVRSQGFAHFNVDFPESFAGNPATVAHVSDHDPLFADLCSDLTTPTLSVSVTPDRLWPPNHKYRTVEARVLAADNADPTPAVELVSVTSDEPDDGTGDGDTANDIVIVDETTFKLRSERAGGGDGRVYTITYRATDACGNSTAKSATVTVSKG